MRKQTTLQKVTNAVKKAYCDSNPNVPFEKTMNKRNLNFKASAPVTKDEACLIMTEALFCDNPDTEAYNSFRPIFLAKLPEGSMVTLAREGSVCAYVTRPEGKNLPKGFAKRCSVDECDPHLDGTIRLWWD